MSSHGSAAGDGQQLDKPDSARHAKTTSMEIPSAMPQPPIQNLTVIESPHMISVATVACRQSLVECLDVQSLKDDWAEDRLADFMLWDAGVGASSGEKSSLEERLVLKPHVRNVVLDLLLVLKSTVDECLELGTA